MKQVFTVPSECVYPTQDNVEGNLVVAKGDYIVKSEDTKYMVIELLGCGTFGQVFRCVSNDGDEVAIKVVKSINRYFQYGMNEVRILKKLNNPKCAEHIVQIYDAFIYKQHLCIVVELLSKSMYDLTKMFRFAGMNYMFLKSILLQILEGMNLLVNEGIVHSDLKPENILISDYFKYKTKIIDFGSSTTRNLSSVFYVQSRFYRAPEVILGIPYSFAIDMWSFGCMAYELFTGRPLFPGKDNTDQITKIHEFYEKGIPLFMLDHGQNTHLYFDKEKSYKLPYNPDKFTVETMIETIQCRIGSKEDHDLFIDLLLKALNPSYLERALPRDLLDHEFFNQRGTPQMFNESNERFIHRPVSFTKHNLKARKMSLYDFNAVENNRNSYKAERKGSVFDPDFENRYNQ